jgi:hypothetical protein
MWTQDWGSLIWGGAFVPLPVPVLGPLGWILLGVLLGVIGALYPRAFSRTGAGVALLVLVTIPLAAIAAQIALPHTFVNGTTADATEVNANFAALEAESNDQDARISDLEGPAFVSDWIAVGRDDQVIVDHDLGLIPTRVSVQVASTATPSVVHVAGYVWQNLDGEGGRGTIATDLTATSVKIRTGRAANCSVFDTYHSNAGSNRICIGNGYARVIVWE